MRAKEFVGDNSVAGIAKDQVRMRAIIHSEPWYDAIGVQIGQGDLDARDLIRISTEIDGADLFIVMPENEGYEKSLESNLKDIQKYAEFIIGKGFVLMVRGYLKDETIEGQGNSNGFNFYHVSRKYAAKVIKKYREFAAFQMNTLPY